MSKAAKWSVAGFLLGVLIFLLSPSFNKLISNFAFWNAFIPVFAAYFYIIKRLMRKYEIKKARQKHAEKLRETAL